MRTLLIALVGGACALSNARSACTFDRDSLSFSGTAVEQARCLLRPVALGGSLSVPLTPLPPPFEQLIGTPAAIDQERLVALLGQLKIPADALGGPLTAPLSRTSGVPQRSATYFVIHDTSNNVCDEQGEFSKADGPAEPWNRVSTWQESQDGHLYITRDGKLIAPQGRTFATAWRGTKLENQLGTASRGLFLHIESVQLRKADVPPGTPPRNPNGDCRNDRLAIEPGFTEVQLDRLALAYIAASARGGRWLIPAYHAALDKGISDGHDDPQRFDLALWGQHICSQLAALGAMC